jgi:hypothetical protein
MATTLLDLARVDGKKLTSQSVAIKLDKDKAPEILEYFTKKSFRSLYRAFIMNTRGRNPSNRECDIALAEAISDTGEDDGPIL